MSLAPGANASPPPGPAQQARELEERRLDHGRVQGQACGGGFTCQPWRAPGHTPCECDEVPREKALQQREGDQMEWRGPGRRESWSTKQDAQAAGAAGRRKEVRRPVGAGSARGGGRWPVWVWASWDFRASPWPAGGGQAVVKQEDPFRLRDRFGGRRCPVWTSGWPDHARPARAVLGNTGRRACRPSRAQSCHAGLRQAGGGATGLGDPREKRG